MLSGPLPIKVAVSGLLCGLLLCPPPSHASENLWFLEGVPTAIQEAWYQWSPFWSPAFDPAHHHLEVLGQKHPWSETDREQWKNFVLAGKRPFDDSTPGDLYWHNLWSEFSANHSLSSEFEGWDSQALHRFLERMELAPTPETVFYRDLAESLPALLNDHVARRRQEENLHRRIRTIRTHLNRISEPSEEMVLLREKATLVAEIEELRENAKRSIDRWNQAIMRAFAERHYELVLTLNELVDFLYPQKKRFATASTPLARQSVDVSEQLLAYIDALNESVKSSLSENQASQAFQISTKLFFLASHHRELKESILPPEIRAPLENYFRKLEQLQSLLQSKDWQKATELLQEGPWHTQPDLDRDQLLAAIALTRQKADNLLQGSQEALLQGNYRKSLGKKQKALEKWPTHEQWPTILENWVHHLQGEILTLREAPDPERRKVLRDLLNEEGQLIFTLLRSFPDLEIKYNRVLHRLDSNILPFQEFLRELSMVRQKISEGSFLEADEILRGLEQTHGNRDEFIDASHFLEKRITEESHREKVNQFRRQGHYTHALSYAESANFDSLNLRIIRQSFAINLLAQYKERYHGQPSP